MGLTLADFSISIKKKRRFSYRNVFPFYVSFILIVMSEATDYGTDFAVTSLSLELY